jgi:surface antigen
VHRLVEDELGLLQIQRTTELSPTVQDELDGRINSKTADAGAKRADTTKAKQALEKLEDEFAASGAPADWSKTE